MIRPISALGSAGGLRAAAPACLQLGRAGTGAAGTCLLGEEVDLSSHVLGNAKLEAVGVARRGQDVPVVGDPRHPLDLEAGNTRGAFVGPTLHPGNRWEPTGALMHRAGTQRGPASTEGWFGGLWGAAPLCYCERRPGTASSELPATRKTKNPQPWVMNSAVPNACSWCCRRSHRPHVCHPMRPPRLPAAAIGCCWHCRQPPERWEMELCRAPGLCRVPVGLLCHAQSRGEAASAGHGCAPALLQPA